MVLVVMVVLLAVLVLQKPLRAIMERRQYMAMVVTGLSVVVTMAPDTVRAGRLVLMGLLVRTVFRAAMGRRVLLNCHGDQ